MTSSYDCTALWTSFYYINQFCDKSNILIILLGKPMNFVFNGNTDAPIMFCISWACARRNRQTDLGTQRKLRSSTQSDQSLPFRHEETLGPYIPNEHTTKTLIRLCRCAGWSESLLGHTSFCCLIVLRLFWHSDPISCYCMRVSLYSQ